MSLGDYAVGATLDFTFTTRFSGVPTVLVGGVVSVYKTNSLTQSVAGITLTADFDSVVGLNHVRLDTTADATFYAAGGDFSFVLTAGTVGGVTVVGVVLDDFSLVHRTNLSAAQVNAEVVDALSTDTYAESGQGAPAATASLAVKLGYLYKAWRNRHTQTATEYALYADNATTKDQEAVVSDDSTTFDRGEVGTGA